MYKIKKYSFDKAKKLGVEIKPSKTGKKKIDVYKDGKLIAQIGHKDYKDFPTYIEEKGLKYANERRRLYNLRHTGKSGINDYYAKEILW